MDVAAESEPHGYGKLLVREPLAAACAREDICRRQQEGSDERGKVHQDDGRADGVRGVVFGIPLASRLISVQLID